MFCFAMRIFSLPPALRLFSMASTMRLCFPRPRKEKVVIERVGKAERQEECIPSRLLLCFFLSPFFVPGFLLQFLLFSASVGGGVMGWKWKWKQRGSHIFRGGIIIDDRGKKTALGFEALDLDTSYGIMYITQLFSYKHPLVLSVVFGLDFRLLVSRLD